MSLVSLVTSGLLDDFPGLNFVFTEAGVSFIKPLVERLDAALGDSLVDYESEDAAARFNYRKLTGGRRIVSEADYKAKNEQPPSHYFRNNLHFTIETEEAELGEAVALFGASQFLFATDYPHDDPGGRMKFRDVELLEKRTDIGARGQGADLAAATRCACWAARERALRCYSLGADVGLELALEQGDLVFEEELAFLEALQLELVLGGALRQR